MYRGDRFTAFPIIFFQLLCKFLYLTLFHIFSIPNYFFQFNLPEHANNNILKFHGNAWMNGIRTHELYTELRASHESYTQNLFYACPQSFTKVSSIECNENMLSLHRLKPFSSQSNRLYRFKGGTNNFIYLLIFKQYTIYIQD